MKVIWTDLAKSQLQEAFQYYKDVEGFRVATSIKSKIYEKTQKLSHFPDIGQVENNPLVRENNYRYLVSGNYKIVYRTIQEKKRC